MSSKLEELIEKCRNITMTEEEEIQQAVSWVLGQVTLSGSEITREDVEKIVRAMRGKSDE